MSHQSHPILADVERRTGGRVEITHEHHGRTCAVLHGGDADGLAVAVLGDELAALRELRRRLPPPAAPLAVFTEALDDELTGAQHAFVNAVAGQHGAARVTLIPAPRDDVDPRPWAHVTALVVEPCEDCAHTGRTDRGEHPICPIAREAPDVHEHIGADCLFCRGLGVILDPARTCPACAGLGEHRYATAHWLIDAAASITDDHDSKAAP